MGAMTADITLSSRLTFITKTIFPACWIIGFGLITAGMWAWNGLPAEMRWAFLAAWIVLLVVVFPAQKGSCWRRRALRFQLSKGNCGTH
jgi:hypothetical protein